MDIALDILTGTVTRGMGNLPMQRAKKMDMPMDTPLDIPTR